MQAMHQAQATDAVAKESGNMRAGNLESAPGDSDTNAISYGP